MRSLGRFSSRYAGLPSPKLSEQKVGSINPDTPFTDLAAADLGKIRVSHWLEPENLSWGIHKGTPAAIIPVRIKAERPPDCKLTDFSLDLRLLPARHSINVSIQNSPQHENLSRDAESKSFPHLVKAPSPEKANGSNPPSSDHIRMAGASSLVSRDAERFGTHPSENWTFRSGCIADHLDRPMTARWTYEVSPFPSSARDHEPFHGAMTLFHDNQEFEVKSSVVGNTTRSRLRLKFGGQTCQPRIWRVEPQSCEDNLNFLIDNLESRVIDLNVPHSAEETRYAIDVGAINARLNAMPVSHVTGESEIVRSGYNYGLSDIGGSANVIMGDVSISYG